MIIPEELVLACRDCKGDVVVCQTVKRMKDATGRMVPVTVILNADEDKIGDSPRSQWVVTLVGKVLHAGQAVNKNQRAGMVAAGIRFHVDHAVTCPKRKAAKGGR